MQLAVRRRLSFSLRRCTRSNHSACEAYQFGRQRIDLRGTSCTSIATILFTLHIANCMCCASSAFRIQIDLYLREDVQIPWLHYILLPDTAIIHIAAGSC